jgi:hypothetical protein
MLDLIRVVFNIDDIAFLKAAGFWHVGSPVTSSLLIAGATDLRPEIVGGRSIK